jgi:hypothetical protein
MKVFKFLTFSCAVAIALGCSSCSDSESYADLLSDETKAVNAFLADHIVILDVPADSVFEIGEDAPFYRMDSDGNVFMQVLDPGTSEKPESDAQVFFRFTRYSLSEYLSTGELGDGSGNAEDISLGSASFRFGNYTLSSSSSWGSGLQVPLSYLGYNCHVNLIIKSQYGLTSEIANVIPYLYDVRYMKAVSE